jgi:hypothetical protein
MFCCKVWTSDLFALNGSGRTCEVGAVAQIFGRDPSDVTGHCEELIGIQDNAKVAMSVTAVSGKYAGSVVVELTLEDL